VGGRILYRATIKAQDNYREEVHVSLSELPASSSPPDAIDGIVALLVAGTFPAQIKL